MELVDNFYHYVNNQDDYVAKYDGKYIILTNLKVGGVYDDFWDAVKAGDLKFGDGNYIIQLVGPGEENYTNRIYAKPRIVDHF
jgi:hypothetical protein